MTQDPRGLVAGTVVACLSSFVVVLVLWSAVSGAVVAVLISAGVVLAFGPSGVAERLNYGVTIGVVTVVAGALVPAGIRQLEQLDIGFRLVASTVATVVVLASGVKILQRFVFEPEGNPGNHE